MGVGLEPLGHLGQEAFPGVGRGLDHRVAGVVVHHQPREEVPLGVGQAEAAFGLPFQGLLAALQGPFQVVQKGLGGVMAGPEAEGPHREVAPRVVEGQGQEALAPVDGEKPWGLGPKDHVPAEHPKVAGKEPFRPAFVDENPHRLSILKRGRLTFAPEAGSLTGRRALRIFSHKEGRWEAWDLSKA